MPVVSEDHRDAMRERLLGAAAKVMVRKGYEGTTIRDVLAEAGVAPNTLYAYFDGKEAILEALTERAVEASAAVVAKVRDDDAATLFGFVLRQAMSTPFPTDALLTELRSHSARSKPSVGLVRRINKSLVDAMRPLVTRLRDDGVVRAEDPDALVELLDIIRDGMLRRASSRTYVTSFERVGAACLEVLARGTLDGVSGAGERRAPDSR